MSKDKFFMEIAKVVSEQSKCNRSKVGAILVKDGNIIAIGYNGIPSGFCNDCEQDDVTLPEVLHAESNAIAKCARSTSSADQSTIYTTMSPCFECSKLIIQAGITRVVYKYQYKDFRQSSYLLAASGIKFNQQS